VGKTIKRNYSALTLREAMELLHKEMLAPWDLDAPSRPASDDLKAHLRRLESFDLENTEQSRTLLIDALFAEVVSDYPNLKIWKAAVLNTDDLTGVADYLIAPKRAYMATPLLCVAEAKRDDFERGRAQCLAEMYACMWTNRRDSLAADVYGIVSNGQAWRFYMLARTGEVYESKLFTTAFMPQLLGALDRICAECSRAAARQPIVAGSGAVRTEGRCTTDRYAGANAR
jgi:hypothetical protein